MAQYDYIIAGGGAAGLALAYEMAASRLRGASILIVDRQPVDRGERTWFYWSNRPNRIDHLIIHRWDRVEFISDYFQRTYDIAPYQFYQMRAANYYRSMHETLAEVPGVQFLQARVDEVSDVKDRTGAKVVIDGVPHGARWAFDSTYVMDDYFRGPRHFHYLKQHYKSWEIETPADSFDPSKATLFDLRTPQKGALRYFSILPSTRRRAQVTYSNFSAKALSPHEYDRAIAEYLANVLRIQEYRTGAIESGVIPITDRPFPRKLGDRVMAIGTRGGLVRPTISSAFPRILRDAHAIVESLINFGEPFQVTPIPSNFRIYDSLMLQVMHRQGDRMKSIMTKIFSTCSIQDIFGYLDGTASLRETTKLMAALPASPFLKALFRVKLLRKV